MIKVTLMNLATLIVGGAVATVGSLWIWSILKQSPISLFPREVDCVRRCPYCTCIVVDYNRRRYVLCPVCQSYLEVESDAKKATQ
jgi:hypothetical protein